MPISRSRSPTGRQPMSARAISAAAAAIVWSGVVRWMSRVITSLTFFMGLAPSDGCAAASLVRRRLDAAARMAALAHATLGRDALDARVRALRAAIRLARRNLARAGLV